MARKSEYKPLLFTTTLRNPERIKWLLWVLQKFNGEKLTDDLATTIVGELIRYGLYRPTKDIPESAKNKWGNTPRGEFGTTLLTDTEVNEIVSNNPQYHKEAGFSKGYPSRFATIFDFTKELGFVYFRPNEPIEFSEIGLRYANVINVSLDNQEIKVEEVHPEYETQAFLQAMSKYQRKNPFIRVLNDNIPLILLLQTIKLLNADTAYNSTGITRKELPLLIFWKDNNAQALYERIKKLRSEHAYKPSDEVVCDICINEIMGGSYKKFKPKSIISEYPDEFIRKMRLTGLITLRGGGRFIDINDNEDQKVDYILKKYSTYKTYEDERAYFDYMATIDENLFQQKTKITTKEKRQEDLKKWVKAYSFKTIKEELNILSAKRNSKDDILKFIDKPTRLEFLVALAIKSKFPHVIVRPNYTTDDEGLPTNTAAGGKGDIECEEDQRGILVEVTMSEGRQQTMMEVWPIVRHLEEFSKNYDKAQCIFIAPNIFIDSQRQIKYVMDTENTHIRAYKINDFTRFIEKASSLYSN